MMEGEVQNDPSDRTTAALRKTAPSATSLEFAATHEFTRSIDLQWDLNSRNEKRMDGNDVSAADALPVVVPEAVIFGIFTHLVVLFAFIVWRCPGGFKQTSRVIVLFICLVMYAMAATHFATTLRYSTVVLLPGTGPGSATCSNPAVLVVNIILSDCIVVWRAWVLWRKRRVVIAISAILILATLILSCLSVRGQCYPPSNLYIDDFGDPFGLAAIVISFLTNVWATALVGYKAWEHRRSMHLVSLGGNACTRGAKSLVIIFESGALYCALWAFLVAYIALYTHSLADWYQNQGELHFIDGMGSLFNTVLIDVIGMYPTALMLTIYLANSPIETAANLDNAAVDLLTQQLHRSPCSVMGAGGSMPSSSTMLALKTRIDDESMGAYGLQDV
ncbi:hypothetical protein PsYK624_044310 [Phanerochaete sordida]|uniref:Uncharacterized protein n=1 Tax=Phanerochaete sordida TaxID=48140 RepID=A0A9P3LBQ9_9APHY|nr:hypothetical protein PsYK624_044310 [Phanerochaete sordida]